MSWTSFTCRVLSQQRLSSICLVVIFRRIESLVQGDLKHRGRAVMIPDRYLFSLFYTTVLGCCCLLLVLHRLLSSFNAFQRLAVSVDVLVIRNWDN